MSDSYSVRSHIRGGLAILRNDAIIVYGLDPQDVSAFVCAMKTRPCEDAPPGHDAIALPTGPPSAIEVGVTIDRRRGRQLVLAEHLDLVTTMIEQNPRITARDVGHALWNRGVKFASLSAVTNLARRYNLTLAA